MKATITLEDNEDGQFTATTEYVGGFNPESTAHTGIAALLAKLGEMAPTVGEPQERMETPSRILVVA